MAPSRPFFFSFCTLFRIPLHSLLGVVLLVFFEPLCIDDHGSFVICRATSVRPNHLSDQNFDHDYYFKLPLQGAGCPIMWTTVLLHAMDGSELSRVRTEVNQLRMLPIVSPHPVQPNSEFSGHGHFGNSFFPAHHGLWSLSKLEGELSSPRLWFILRRWRIL
jgi:hypothetical protein